MATTYQLTFASGLHLGTRGVNLEEHGVHLPSDTLFAALLDAWRRLGGDPQAFARPFVEGAPPFLLSSAFPFAGGVRFFPMPADVGRVLSPQTLRARGKDAKGIHYLSEALWRRALSGQLLDDQLFPADELEDPTTGVALQGGALWLSKAEVPQLPDSLRRANRSAERQLFALRRVSVWASQRVPRVTVDRIASSSTIFHAGRTTFAAGCGLWFAVQWRDPQAKVLDSGPLYQEALRLALQVLEHDGLGGERSSGYGAFAAHQGSDLDLPDPLPGRPAWLLSRYHPKPTEALATVANGAAYRLISVAGWLRTPDGPAQRRKRLILLAEGSIVPLPAYPAGDVSDVRPTYANPAGDTPHPVYRYGLALAAGIRTTGVDHHG